MRSAPNLHELQGLFWRTIAENPSEVSNVPRFLERVESGSEVDHLARVRVYSDAYFLRLRDVLMEDFPTVLTILGAERFDKLVQDYLRAWPSSQPSVRYVGSALPEFIAGELKYPRFLADLALLEWARLDVFDAADDKLLTVEDLTRVPYDQWPSMRFRRVQALRVIHTRWPVQRLWAGETPDKLRPAPTSLRIWRARDFQVFHTVMEWDEAEALGRLVRGETFASVCEAFVHLPPAEAASEATALLARWLQDGLLSRRVAASTSNGKISR